MSNFDPNSVTGLVGLWDFINGNSNADTGLDDGIAQNGHFHGNGSASGDRAHFDGNGDYFDVEGDDGGPEESVFDMARGTIEVQFTQDQHIGSSPDSIVNRGEYDDRGSEGYFNISVLQDGRIKVIHCNGDGDEEILTTQAGIVDPGDLINVKYTWDEDTGVTLVVENLTDGNNQTLTSNQTGLTMDIGDNDDEIFTFGAREEDDAEYDHYFDGSIDYVAVYESETAPDGAVDGEAFGEVMELGYDDSNAPTNQGGDIITEDADLIYGNGGDDTIDGEGGDDTIYGDSGGSGSTTREIFEWDEAPNFGHDNDANGFTQDTGNANVTFSILYEDDDAETVYETTDQNTDDLDAAANENASLESITNGDDGAAGYRWVSDTPLENVEFRINDIDGDGQVTVRAWDADGNPIEVVLSDAGTGLDLSDTDGVAGNDTAASNDDNYHNDDSPQHSVLVTIPGPVVRFEIYHEQLGNLNTGINVTDIAFDVTDFDPGVAGDDVITGGGGSDDMFGEDGDDTFIVSTAADGDGDVIVGGNGPDDETDNDVLDLRGTGRVTIVSSTDGSDDGALMGTVTFEDGSTLEFSQIETILTDPQNEDPDAMDDVVNLDEDTSATFDPTANDSDPDGDPLEVISIDDPVNGTLTDNGDGTYTYTPDENWNGSETITYTISDGNGGTDTAEITFNVAPVNDVAETDEETPILIDVLANDTDVDGDDLTITGASVPAEQGTVSIVGNELRYVPADDFFGEATISYSITDGNGGTDVAEVTVTVNNVNDAPIAVDDFAETDEDVPVVVDLLGNDVDVDGDDLEIISLDVDPAVGSVVDNGDGTVTFTPAPNYNGPAIITYVVSDGNGGTDTGMATVNVGAVNDGPTANDDVAETDEDTPVTIDVLANDTDPDGDDLEITGASVPANQGTVEIIGNELVFTPAENYNGPATITYSITDGNGGTSDAEVAVTVHPVNDDPVAVDDIDTTDEDVPVVVDLLGNDTDVDGDDLEIFALSVPPEQGSVVDNGDGTVTFTPALNFNGPATISYTVTDGNGGFDDGEAIISVGAVNDAPIAEDDLDSTDEDTPVTIDVLFNDSDPDGDDLTIISATVPADEGTVEIVANELLFTPAEHFNGTATITYTISDGNGLTDTAEVTVVIAPDDDAPIVVDDVAETDEDTPVVIDPLANDTHPDGDALMIAGTPTALNGTVVVNPDGTITYTPNQDFNGSDTITYIAEDPDGDQGIGLIEVTVNPINDDPDAVDDSSTTDQGTPVIIDVLANDSDVEGDTLTVDSITQPPNGTVVDNGDGTVSYTPDVAFVGTDTFTYTVSDGNGGTDTATVSVVVNDVIGPVDGLDTG